MMTLIAFKTRDLPTAYAQAEIGELHRAELIFRNMHCPEEIPSPVEALESDDDDTKKVPATEGEEDKGKQPDTKGTTQGKEEKGTATQGQQEKGKQPETKDEEDTAETPREGERYGWELAMNSMYRSNKEERYTLRELDEDESVLMGLAILRNPE